MAAAAWKPFRQAKLALGAGTMVLSGGVFKIALAKSAAVQCSAASSASTWASLKTDGVAEVGSAARYSSSGVTLSNHSWALSGNNAKFDGDDWILTASGGAITSIKTAIIRESAGDQIFCYSTLTSTPIASLADGSTLTITMASAGIMVLS